MTTTTTWIAAHRTAVLGPHEDVQLFPSRSFTDQTVRQPLRLAGGGEALRVRLSNRYGTAPLEIGGAHLATRTRGSGIDPATDIPLTFSGTATATIPAGEELVSDPVHQPFSAGQELALSLHLPGDTGPTTFSPVAHDIGHAAPGSRLDAEVLDGAEEFSTGHLLAGVDVLAPADTRIVVAFGDSWIEGAATTPGADNSFPSQLGRRLDRGWIVNQGLSGNRLLTDGIGEHLLARIDHDVLAVPGVSHVLVHIGLNDLGLPGVIAHPEPAEGPTAAEFIAGLTTLADRLHTAGLTVIACTLGTYQGATYDGFDSAAGQATRAEINAWLLGDDHPFDAVADTAAAVADPAQPARIRAEFNAGDGLHVNDAGAKALADAVDTTLLKL
jgi:lysophospholipase L1-like esterase